jgi:hypothetical protein
MRQLAKADGIRDPLSPGARAGCSTLSKTQLPLSFLVLARALRLQNAIRRSNRVNETEITPDSQA